MNAIFTNTYTSSKKYFREIYASIYFKKPLTIVVLIVTWLLFFTTLALLIMGMDYTIAGFLGAPWFTLTLLYVYFRQVSFAIKRENEKYDGFATITSNVTDEYIDYQSSSGNSSRLEYGNIASITKTKNLILIKTKARFLFIMDRSTFVGGTDEDFIRYLKIRVAKA